MNTVHTVWDFYDGPRTGIADYRGEPHYYSCQWNAVADDYNNFFALSAIDSATFALALEQWQIWRKWESAFHSGQVPSESHPGFGGRDDRYDELQLLLQERIEALPAPIHFARAEFHSASIDNSPAGVMRPLLVEWTDVDAEPDALSR